MYYSEATGGGGTGPLQVFIGAIHLKPGQIWQQTVRAYHPRSESDEEKSQEVADRFLSYFAKVNDERIARGESTQNWITVTDAELVASAQDLANQNFTLSKGRYELYIGALDWDRKVLGAIKHSFSISDSSIAVLRNVIGDYRYGLCGSPYQCTIIEPRLSPPEEGKRC